MKTLVKIVEAKKEEEKRKQTVKVKTKMLWHLYKKD